MKTSSLAAWMLVTGAVFQLTGCAAVSGHDPSSQPPRSSVPSSTASGSTSGDGSVTAAVAVTDADSQAGPSPVRWTAGVLEDSATAVKQGVNKVADALTPAPVVPPSDDPTLLANKAKPSPELYIAMARFYEQSGQSAQAERVYQQSLRLWPKHVGTVLNYARFKDRQGLPQEALRLYQDAARDFPKEATVHNDLGLFLRGAERTRRHCGHFRRPSNCSPNGRCIATTWRR